MSNNSQQISHQDALSNLHHLTLSYRASRWTKIRIQNTCARGRDPGWMDSSSWQEMADGREYHMMPGTWVPGYFSPICVFLWCWNTVWIYCTFFGGGANECKWPEDQKSSILMLGLPSRSKSMHKLAMIQGQRKHKNVGIFFTKFPRKQLCRYYKLIDLVNSTSNKRSGGITSNGGEISLWMSYLGCTHIPMILASKGAP